MSEIEVIARGVHVSGGKLLVCHAKGADNTYLPGGHVDFGEDAKSALVREIDEEMGLDSSVTRFLGACDHAYQQKGQPHCEVNLVFEMNIEGLSSDAEPASEEDHIEFQWLDVDSLSDSDLEPRVLREVIHAWIQGPDQLDRWTSSI
jgi:8-oxo-dGTP diphosphatase